MIKDGRVTCDQCGDDITTMPHWEIDYVIPGRDGKPVAGRETRNSFCTACW